MCIPLLPHAARSSAIVAPVRDQVVDERLVLDRVVHVALPEVLGRRLAERDRQLPALAVVLAIFVSACVAGYESVVRLLHPEELSHLWAVALALKSTLLKRRRR